MPINTLKYSSILLVAFAAFTTTTASAQVPGSNRLPKVIPIPLVDRLNDWITKNSEYAPRDELLPIYLVDTETANRIQGGKASTGGNQRGLYDEEKMTIYLVEPWDSQNTYDQSILLHELIHHRQVTAKHWYCAEAQEWPAYKLQAAFLEENNIEPDFYWPAILLGSSCTRRDIHEP